MFDYTNNKKIIGTNTNPIYALTEVLFLLHISILYRIIVDNVSKGWEK